MPAMTAQNRLKHCWSRELTGGRPYSSVGGLGPSSSLVTTPDRTRLKCAWGGDPLPPACPPRRPYVPPPRGRLLFVLRVVRGNRSATARQGPVGFAASCSHEHSRQQIAKNADCGTERAHHQQRFVPVEDFILKTIREGVRPVEEQGQQPASGECQNRDDARVRPPRRWPIGRLVVQCRRLHSRRDRRGFLPILEPCSPFPSASRMRR